MLNRILLLLLLILPMTAPARIILIVGDSLSASDGLINVRDALLIHKLVLTP